jgi:porin
MVIENLILLKRFLVVLLVLGAFLLKGQTDSAEVYKNTDNMGGPKSIGRQLEEDNAPMKFEYRYQTRVLKDWYELKKRVNAKTGIQFNLNYTSVYIHSSEVISDNSTAGVGSGIVDIQLGWNLIGRKSGKNKGTLFLKMNSRHGYSGLNRSLSPMFHGLNQSGYYGLPATGFNSYTFRMLELNWQQNLLDDKLGLVVGKVDLTNYFNFHGLIIPWRHFLGFGSSVSGSMNWGNQGLGAVASYRVTKSFYAMAGLVDVYGDQFLNGEFLDFGRHWQDGDFQYMGEIGWVPTYDERYFKKFSLTFFTANPYTSFQTGSEIAKAQGMAFSAHWFFKERFAPYIRFGVSNGVGENNFYSADIQVGHGLRFRHYDLLGTAFSWNRPNIPDVNDQYTAEVFYRVNVSSRLEITPSVQFIVNPTFNPAISSLFYFGIRGRATL